MTLGMQPSNLKGATSGSKQDFSEVHFILELNYFQDSKARKEKENHQHETNSRGWHSLKLFSMQQLQNALQNIWCIVKSGSNPYKGCNMHLALFGAQCRNKHQLIPAKPVHQDTHRLSKPPLSEFPAKLVPKHGKIAGERSWMCINRIDGEFRGWWSPIG